MSDTFNLQLQAMTSGVARHDTGSLSSAGTCVVCGSAIISGSALVDSSDRAYHPEHFLCSKCRVPLTTEKHYVTDGKLFCAPCWEKVCEKCAKCGGAILQGQKLTAMGKKWHPEHFVCSEPGCSVALEGDFATKDGKPFCTKHVTLTKCAGCGGAISGPYLNAIGLSWHSDHFVCASCRRPFEGGQFFEHNKLPYCKEHFHQATRSLCAACNKPATGTCVTAIDKVWHTDCWLCTLCKTPLKDAPFLEHNKLPYCRSCHSKLF